MTFPPPGPRADDDATIIRPLGTAPGPMNGDAVGAGAAPSSVPALASKSAAHAAHAEGGNALQVGSRQGEFEITRVLGEGGFGIVYLARDHALERMVALKEYMPAALALRGERSEVRVRSERHRETFDAGLKSFINEARLLAQFDHPSLVKVHRFWEANGTAFMVMPFVEGRTLKDTLRDLGEPPSEAWLMDLLAPLTEALMVLHGENCYHRDIAPDNIILVSGSGLPMLLDFGAARRVIGDMTQALTVILKPGYAPIEQYAEIPSLKQGPWTDVYALAAVVYMAIAGRTPPASVGRIVKDDYVPLAESGALTQGRYSARLLHAVDAALRVLPDQRTASMQAFREALGLAAQPAARAVQGSTRLQLHRAAVADTAGTAPGHNGAATAGLTAGAAAAASGAAAGPTSAGRPRSAVGSPVRMALLACAALAVAGTAYVLMRPSAPAAGSAPQAQGATAASPVDRTPAANSGATPALGPGSSGATAPGGAPPSQEPALAAPAPGGEAVLADLHGQFLQLAAQHTPGFDVVARPERAQLRIDRDDLRFTVTATRAGHVYVLLAGPDGSLLQIYPNSRAANNRLAANQTLKLPHASWPLKAGEPAGLEHFLVLVTEDPHSLAPWASGKDADYGFLSLPARPPAAARAAGTRWLLGQPACAQPPCSAAFGAAVFSVDVVR